MMIPIKLKEGHSIPQPIAKKWEKGFFVDSLRGGDDRPYAVILTEHNEFELVVPYSIIATN